MQEQQVNTRKEVRNAPVRGRRLPTIQDLVFAYLSDATGPSFIEDIVDAVVAERPDVQRSSVKSEIALMASPAMLSITRIRRSWYALPVERSEEDDVALVKRAVLELLDGLDWEDLELPDHESTGLALVDAVFDSKGSRSKTDQVVGAVRQRWSTNIDVASLGVAALLGQISESTRRPSGTPWSFRDTAFEEALLNFYGLSLRDRSWALSKARIVPMFAERLLSIGDRQPGAELPDFDDRQSFDQAFGRDVVTENQMKVLDAIHGDLAGIQGVGPIMVRQFLQLVGVDVITPNVDVARWVQGALGGEIAPLAPARAAELVEDAVHELQDEGLPIRLSVVDRLVTRSRTSRRVTPGTGVHRIGPSTASGVVTRRQRAAGHESTQVRRGIAVDWSPALGKRARERWHGEVLDDPVGGVVTVRWTTTDSTRNFHRGSAERLELPFDEVVSVEDLIPCEISGARHPIRERDPSLGIGDQVERLTSGNTGSRWFGEIVGRYRTSFIVKWTRTDASDPRSFENPEERVELPCFSVEPGDRLLSRSKFDLVREQIEAYPVGMENRIVEEHLAILGSSDLVRSDSEGFG